MTASATMTESEFQQALMANLERIRGHGGLTIVEFSKLCGVTPRGYYWWLTGTMPGVYHLYQLANGEWEDILP